MALQENTNIIIATLGLLIVVILSAVQIIRGRRPPFGMITLILLIIGVLLMVALTRASEIKGAEWVQIILTIGLVVITAVYAYYTEKMVEEMRDQRVISSRPLIILKSVHEEYLLGGTDYFSHFEISNVGNSPAIEVESSLMINKQDYTHSIRQTYLRKEDTPIKWSPDNIAALEENRTYYLACEYQDIFSHEVQKRFHRTWMPFKISKSSEKDKVYLIAGELQFEDVSEKERIDAFGSRSKPK